MSLSKFFVPEFILYTAAEVRRIRQCLGESQAEFARRFFVSVAAVKSWEAQEGTSKHRDVTGAAARCMYWAAEEANNNPSAINNLIRLGVRGKLS